MKSITLHTEQKIKNLRNLFGIFFEDINHAADGGLYPELIQNRSFEFDPIDNKEYHSLTAWDKDDEIEWKIVTENSPSKNNPHHLIVNGIKGKSIRNSGFNSGIFIQKDKTYKIQFRAKASDISKLKFYLEDSANSSEFIIDSCDWKIYTAKITSSKNFEGKLTIEFENNSIVEFDFVSLYPEETFNNRPNGLRPDIANALKEMKPKFIRFPGGCLVHDGSLNKDDRNSLYRWKNTIGPIFDRPARRNNWNYNQTLGLGYYEYFLFAEDIGATPLPVLPAAFNPHKGDGVPLDSMQEWIDDALDLIEFANGETSTKWGKIRADLGHEKPFNLKYIAIGNEEIGEGFFERYPIFHKAIKEKYPQIKIINSAGPFATGEGYETGWNSAKKNKSDLVDEHYYCSPEWFLSNMNRYSSYDENGPHVFLGEYASWGNTFKNSIVEAAYMTHLEKAPAVELACYAPMLCNVDYVNWKPDMIFFDNKRILKTANYYVQKLFMENQGENEISTSSTDLQNKFLLSEKNNLSGKILIQGNDVEGKIYDIKLKINDQQKNQNNIEITTDNIQHQLFEISENENNWELEFKFKRSKGRKGLKILFALSDEKNYINWEFGGWDNWDCNLTSVINNRASTISHRIFHVTDEEYTLRLVAKNSTIKTFINGTQWNETNKPVPEIQELYWCASKDNDDIILKAVNISGEDKEVELNLDSGKFNSANISILSGKDEDENSFDNPDLIKPQYLTESVHNNKLKWNFTNNSLTVIRFSKN